MDGLGFDFTFENIEKLADIVKDKELNEITIEGKDVKITLKNQRKCPPPPMGAPMGMPPVQMGMPPVQMGMPTGMPAAQGTNDNAAPAVSGKEVKAPIVGTFYAAPSPDSAPFVSVGDKVKKGDVIFIIESMKVMSEVQSEFDGVVKEVCVNSGDAVEFDQTVMIIG